MPVDGGTSAGEGLLLVPVAAAAAAAAAAEANPLTVTAVSVVPGPPSTFPTGNAPG